MIVPLSCLKHEENEKYSFFNSWSLRLGIHFTNEENELFGTITPLLTFNIRPNDKRDKSDNIVREPSNLLFIDDQIWSKTTNYTSVLNLSYGFVTHWSDVFSPGIFFSAELVLEENQFQQVLYL